MKRILFVYHVTNVGGGSYCLLNLLKVIDRTVFEPVVMLPGKGPLCEEIEKLGIEIVYFPKLKLYPYNKSLWSFKVLRTLFLVNRCQKFFSQMLSLVKPEIVYYNTMMLFPYLQTAKDLGCKTVLHVREHWPLDEHTKQLERARRIVYTNADILIAINRYSASIFPKKKATIVYDWINMEARRGGPTLDKIMTEELSGKKVYLFTGGLQVIKGTIEILQIFTRYITGENCRLLLLGVDPNMEWDGLRGKVKKVLSIFGYKTYKEKVVTLCQKDKRIICAPATYQITDLMEQVDAYISFFTIPHANLALAESIVVGLPAIAGLSDESLEYSGEGYFALLYDFGNTNAFKDTWQRLDRCGDDLRERMKQRSSVVADKFCPTRNAGVFNDVLRTM